MPWKVDSVINNKQKFIVLYESGKFTIAELCREFNISRPTGYQIINRYRKEGYEGLLERSKAHKTHPLQTKKYVEDKIQDYRAQHKTWGANKIRELLFRDKEVTDEDIPSETTVNAIMRKHGLTMPRKSKRSRLLMQNPYFDPVRNNEIWSADFKGKFRMRNQVYCNPLTVADSKSRYIFAIDALDRPDTEHCRPVFERIFREYGLPEYLHTDNGAPFGNVLSLRRMTRLSVWFMDQDIIPVYSDPGRPDQNGRHERMHRDLKAEATRPPGANMKEQQKIFDSFRNTYNVIRPHEALDMMTPEESHTRSNRPYRGQYFDYSYPTAMKAKLVTVNGAIRWGNDHFVMISTALSGRYIGMDEVDDGVWGLYYRQVALGYFSERTLKTYEIGDYNV